MSINKALGNRDLVSALQVDEDLKQMENTYAEFFSRLKMACNANVARCFMTGVTPLALNKFMSGFNITEQITHDLEFVLLYGFTEADIWNGLTRLKPQLGGDPEVVERIVGSWKHNHNGYYFDPCQKVVLYNLTRVLHELRQLE